MMSPGPTSRRSSPRRAMARPFTTYTTWSSNSCVCRRIFLTWPARMPTLLICAAGANFTGLSPRKSGPTICFTFVTVIRGASAAHAVAARATRTVLPTSRVRRMSPPRLDGYDLVRRGHLLGEDLRVDERGVLALEIVFGDPTGHRALPSDEDRHPLGDDLVDQRLHRGPRHRHDRVGYRGLHEIRRLAGQEDLGLVS